MLTLLSVVMIVMVGCWLLFVGGAEIHQELWETLDSLGKVTTNVTSNLADVEQAPASQQFVSFIARLLTVGVWLLALEGMIQLWRMRRGLVRGEGASQLTGGYTPATGRLCVIPAAEPVRGW